MAKQELQGHVAVVTGASSGIGRLSALEFARHGASVMAGARGERALATLREEARDLPGRIEMQPTDVARPEQVTTLAEAAVGTFGRIDSWVNNAAVMIYAGVEATDADELRQLLEVNVGGVYNGIKAVLPIMRRQGTGTIINIGSVESLRAIPLQSAYAASKHAVKAVTEALRVELADEKSPIRVVLIEPSYINTPLFNHARSKIGASPQPLPPMYEPEAVASAILHVARRPIDEVVVGGAGKGLTVLERISPTMVDKAMLAGGVAIEAQHRDEPPQPVDNLFGPIDEPGAVRGEWSSISKGSSWYTSTLGLHRGFRRLLGIGAAAGMTLVLLRRR